MTTCIHCNEKCRLTTGAEVYPHRPDLHSKQIWVCDPCNARVGCHGNTDDPLGYAANSELRKARIALHNQMIDPLWKHQKKRRYARSTVYKFLSLRMGLEPDETHTGMFTIEQCREAWRALRGLTFSDIEKDLHQREPAA